MPMGLMAPREHEKRRKKMMMMMYLWRKTRMTRQWKKMKTIEHEALRLLLRLILCPIMAIMRDDSAA